VAKKPTSRKLSVYSNLSKKLKVKKDAESRRRAEYLATLPKHPVKRFFHRLHPKRVWAYWFSKRGVIMALKIAGVTLLVLAITAGALFAYFRKDLDQIRPGEIDKRVQSTVTKYYDRNDQLLWEDTGGGNYKLVVPSSELSDNLKKATVAIEDRDFYKHSGVSFTGTVRAAVNNFTGGSIQGGSTLTQQLVKQVFFPAEEVQDRGVGGIPRKIKELILAVEIERMYNKDQILALYLNESPYGGPRNGAESAAQAYFGKPAKDLTLAEAALLAAIPQNPSAFNPYLVSGHERLIARQHEVLNAMREVGYITQAQADEAKQIPIIDTLRKPATLTENIKAPHFVQMVRAQLEKELGVATVGRGGLIVKTTLDLRVQQKTEEAMTDMFNSATPRIAGFENGAATVADTKTGQIIALVGSRNFQYEGFGQDNAATAYIQPGSSVKPFVYSELFEQKPQGSQNYGSGTILKDENINTLYRGTLNNADRRFLGDVTIRTSLATSRNVPAVKAMAINEKAKEGSTLEKIHQMGAPSYCSQGDDRTVSYALAIGGCGVSQTDMINAYTTLARGGIKKPQSSVLEVKNSSGEVLKKWSDVAGERVVSEQASYIVSDILSDGSASAALGNYAAKNIPGVKTATKTGTSDKDGKAKDLWMFSYSPSLTMGVWLGNPDTTILKQGTSSIGSPIVAKVMEFAHKDVYAAEGKWKSGDWYAAPNGIQREGKEVYPSWWSKTQGRANAKLTFDRVSKKKATSCTPADARIELDVTQSKDPITGKESYVNVPEGYDANAEDDAHKCGEATPIVGNITVQGTGGGTWRVSIAITQGAFGIDASGVTVTANGSAISVSKQGDNYVGTVSGSTQPPTGTVRVVDSGYYSTSKSF
jgi:penicillin-binding protein 1A